MSDAAAPPAWLYLGRVVHERRVPRRHRFRYRVFSLYLDIDRVAEVAASCRIFSHGRLNLLSFHEADHGARDGSPLRPWVEGQLRAAGIRPPGGTIHLLCFPRVLGYVFNPLSIFYCADAQGRLGAVLYEVRNTFGESHSYAIAVPSGAAPDACLSHSAAKHFHVSPFLAMDATYLFRLRPPGERLAVTIRESQAGQELLTASHCAARRPLSDRSLSLAFLGHPLMTVKVIAAIHWQALRLLAKGAVFHRRPPKPRQSVTAAVVAADLTHPGARS